MIMDPNDPTARPYKTDAEWIVLEGSGIPGIDGRTFDRAEVLHRTIRASTVGISVDESVREFGPTGEFTVVKGRIAEIWRPIGRPPRP